MADSVAQNILSTRRVGHNGEGEHGRQHGDGSKRQGNGVDAIGAKVDEGAQQPTRVAVQHVEDFFMVLAQ